MGQIIDGAIELIKILNSQKNLSLNLKDLANNLNITDEELKLRLEALDKLDDYIKYDQNRVSLKERLDLLNEELIYKSMQGRGRVAVLASIDSTNTYMLNYHDNLVSGDTILAEYQYQGRGRRGGQWHSKIGKQLTLSICFDYDDFEQMQGLSIGIGVAVAQCIESFGFENIQLKWPNDIYKDHKKVGGILIETVRKKDKIVAVIGIGLNVYPDSFTDLNREYTSIFEKKTSSKNRNLLAIALINNVKRVCADFKRGRKLPYVDAFAARDELLGKYIKVTNDDGEFVGRACGLDEFGRLILAQKDTKISIQSGHISFL